MAVQQSKSTDDINGAYAIHLFADPTGGTIIIPSIALAKLGRVLSKTFFQVTGSVQISYTLSQQSVVNDSSNQAAVLWDGPTTIPANTIYMVEKSFTAIRLVFAAAGEAHIAAS